ncbi:MAG: DeoR/GlpR transcriptional regulator [Spirochaetaceae bacterium]|nr:MAG: DeoR/GlpR transcriptional regulator [Spirochaetaceae bacterium]
MFVEQRLDQFLQALGARGSITVDQAAELAGVSQDTVRRDFNRLAERGLALRTHGGIMTRDNYVHDSTIRERRIQHAAQKAAIARAAAALVVDNETIALDGGTTTFGVIAHLSPAASLTLITYSLDAAIEVARRPNMSAIVLGGVVREPTLSVVGPDAMAMVRTFHANTFLLGANAVSLEFGLMTPNRMEAELKTALIAISDRVVLLVDSSKINKRALVTFGSLDSVTTLVTDAGADPQFCEQLRQKGTQVIIARQEQGAAQ